MKFLTSSIVFVIASLVLAVNAYRIARPKRYSTERDFDCNGTSLSRPFYFQPHDTLFQTCFIEAGKVENSKDSLPAIEWKTYLCVLNGSSAFPKHNETFDDYLTFMTSKYPDEFSKNIKIAVKQNCTEVDDKLESWEKVMKYAQCFYRIEEQVCVGKQKTGNSSESGNRFEMKCEPLPGSSFDGCCKDSKNPMGLWNSKPLPVGLSRLVVLFLINSSREAEKVPKKDFKECQKTITDRQKKLQEGLNSSQGVYTDMCEYSCAFRPEKYIDIKSLKLNFTEQIENHALELLPKALGTKIRDLIPKYKKSLQYEIRVQDQVYKNTTFAKHVEQFDEITDELEKIRAYCDIPRRYVRVLMPSFSEYCLGPDAVKRVFKSFLVEE